MISESGVISAPITEEEREKYLDEILSELDKLPYQEIEEAPVIERAPEGWYKKIINRFRNNEL